MTTPHIIRSISGLPDPDALLMGITEKEEPGMKRRWYVYKRSRQAWSGQVVPEWVAANFPKGLLASLTGRVFPTWQAAMDHVSRQIRKATNE